VFKFVTSRNLANGGTDFENKARPRMATKILLYGTPVWYPDAYCKVKNLKECKNEQCISSTGNIFIE
jgi:hypothetical protein